MDDPARASARLREAKTPPAAHPRGFRLLRYFTTATLLPFGVAALALFVLQGMEDRFFERVQREQSAHLAQAQAQLAREHEQAARSSLLAVHQASHVNLTQLLANTLWQSDFAPFVAAAQRVPIDACRALPAQGAVYGAADGATNPRRDCFAEVGRRILALPGFAALDRRAYAAMRDSSVFKIKVFDLRGVTVYSSEKSQIGEDAADNQGWRSAAAGQPASELTHRDRFSAFERVVENRDLISSYVPLRAPGRNAVVGVFEIYADVTPFLAQLKATSARFAEITRSNEARVAEAARGNEQTLRSSSDRFLLIVGGLLILLYLVSLLIVRIGQRIIDRQSLAQEQSARREQLWHREKMAALATMAANVSHDVGNPLTVISGLAEEIAESESRGGALPGAALRLREQTARIERMTRQIADFATARSESAEWVDPNAMVKAVCDFLRFDRRFRGTPIEFRPDDSMPACELVPDHLNELLMGLLQAFVDAGADRPACERILVETRLRGGRAVIRIAGVGERAGDAVFTPERLAPLRRRAEAMGFALRADEDGAEIELPAPHAA